MNQKIFKTGNSLGLTIPSAFVHALGLRPGASVVVKVDLPRLRITYEFSGTQQLTLLTPKPTPAKK